MSAAEIMWDALDEDVELGDVLTDVLVLQMKELIKNDPEGAVRRAKGRPQYDHQRGAYAAYHQLVEAEGGEHEPVPDGGGDQPQPHPEQFALAAPALRDCE